MINVNRMIHYRYERLQEQIARHRCDAALLFSSMNVRYASETPLRGHHQYALAYPGNLRSR